MIKFQRLMAQVAAVVGDVWGVMRARGCVVGWWSAPGGGVHPPPLCPYLQGYWAGMGSPGGAGC